MYEGIKEALKLLNYMCDQNGCNEKCPVFKKCKMGNWKLLRDDLEDLNIECEEVGL